MKKVNIVTLNGYNNYGNRLQLFALSTIVKKEGFECRSFWPKSIRQRIKEFLKYYTPLCIYFRKEKKFFSFSRKYTPKTARIMKNDIAIVGSDQVWNPDYLETRPFLLDVPNCAKIISYAASIGYCYLSPEQISRFSKCIKNYFAISIREESAKKLLQPLTDKKIERVLDPTLLLNKEEYCKLEKRPDNIKENEEYVLCYILGGHERMEVIQKFAKRHNYKIILLSDRKDSKYGVEEFLYLIHHAQLICTDSFHACVFSMIFERPFVAFRRTGEADYMYTRLQNLINTFRLKNREFNGEEITEENLKVDYSDSKNILEKEREKSIIFLKKALGDQNE